MMPSILTWPSTWPGMLWPWLVLAGLGMFHGLNPAMGWLFAVALGLQRGSGRVVSWALLPIALGHAAAIWLVAVAVLALGSVLDPPALNPSLIGHLGALRLLAGAVLILWALYHWVYGHRHRLRVGMTTGFLGLAAWSFLMATGHGAGLMLVPALMPLCLGGTGSGQGIAVAAGAQPFWMSAAAVAVHTLAMLLVIGLVAAIVYRWLGLGFLRRGWINFDLLWCFMLVATGVTLMVT